MDIPQGIGQLPGFFALDVHAVNSGVKQAASVQLDDTYFKGQLAALQAIESSQDLKPRIETIQRSAQTFARMECSVDSLTRPQLLNASETLLDTLRELPEIEYIRRHTPGTCFVVPEWSKTDSQIHYGARVYVFESDAPDPMEIVEENVDAVVDGAPKRFDRYRGRLHGYPECCIESYLEQAENGSSPERNSMQPYDEFVDDKLFSSRRDPSTRIDELVPTLFETEDAYAFFAREFFPEVGCESARTKGKAVYDALVETYPEALVRDYFRLNFGFSALMAQATVTNASGRPPAGMLGREGRYFYLPLSALLAVYQSGQ